MSRVFIDAGVLFSAALSEHGGSREIIQRGIRGELEVGNAAVEQHAGLQIVLPETLLAHLRSEPASGDDA